MSKFNKSVDNSTENLAGGKAYIMNEKLKFISLVLNSFVIDQFYRSENDTIQGLLSLINDIKDKKFIAKTALFARLKFGMRSISHIITAELAKIVKKEEWSKCYYEKIIHRVDDITEILSYYIKKHGKPIPNALRKGLKKAFDKFDEYQLAKYRGEGKEVKLIDVVNLLHPIPCEKNKEALNKLVKNELKSHDTWESDLVRAGQNAKNEKEKIQLKEEVWKKLLFEKKIGYFALLRNLRNIFEQANEYIDLALELLVDEKLIKNSLVLPFRFTTAYDEIKEIPGSQKILKAISKAVDISLINVPKFDGETLVVLDCSGSMVGKPSQIGSLFAAISTKTNDCDFMSFSDRAKYQVLNSLDSTITLANSIRFAAGGTDFNSIFKTASKKYDRIIILSDMQGWINTQDLFKHYNNYKLKYDCDPFIYSIDLQGYGTLQFPQNKVFCLAGFSEKIFDLMKLLEQDRNVLINEIEKIEI